MSLLELQRRRALRVPADSRPGARLARRRRVVPARPRAADPNGGLRAAEPLRRLPRGAVRAGQARLRPVAAHQVPVVRRARRARLRDARDPRGQEPVDLARDGATARPALPRRARAPRGRRAPASPGRGRAVGARRPAARAGPGAEGATAAARPARALRRARRPQRRLRGPAPAHERAGALGPALPGAGRGRRAGRARDRRRFGRRSSRRSASCRAGSRGGRTGSSSGWSAKGNWCARRTAGWRRKSGAAPLRTARSCQVPADR